MPTTVWKTVPGSAMKWELVYAKKIKAIIWGWGKRMGHIALSPSTSWHLSFPENQATAEQREEMAINHSHWRSPLQISAFLKSSILANSSTSNSVLLKGRGAQQKEGQDPQPPEPLAGSSAQPELSSKETGWQSPHQLLQQRDVLINTVSRNREKAYFDLD